MKPWYQSKTLWFNVLAGAAALFGSDGSFGHVFSAEEVGLGLGLGNMALRFMTSEGLVK